MAHISNPDAASTETLPAGRADLTESASTNQDASTSAGLGDCSGTPMKRRRKKTPSGAKVSKPPTSPPDDQFISQKSSASRMHLNLQMFRKHPIFKFFVTAPVDSEKNPHKWRCRVCHLELSLKTKGALEILSHYRTNARLTRGHRIPIETPVLPLFDSNELELSGPALEKARAKAELELPIAPTLGECYLMPGQRRLPEDITDFDPSAVACSQTRILLTALQNSGTLSSLVSLRTNLGLEIHGPAKVPQYNWRPERIFVSIFLTTLFSLRSVSYLYF